MGRTKLATVKGRGKVLATSNTLEGLKKLISEYYMGSTIKIFGSEVFNKKGKIPDVYVTKGKRYQFKRHVS